MASNYLKLNDDKTEFIILGSKHNQAKVSTKAVLVGENRIVSTNSVCNIGAFLMLS